MMPLGSSVIYPASEPAFLSFPSRRSVVHSTEGMIACTQPLAARCGQKVLEMGGNAADAAVAVAAGMNMAEPCMTGIGGDMFCLYYDAKTKKVSALNGSGRTGAKCTLEQIRQDLKIEQGVVGTIPTTSIHSVTVPGAAAGWADTVEHFGSGKLTLAQILQPAIVMGEEGFPVSEIAARNWAIGEPALRKASPNFPEMLKQDSEPGTDGFRSPKAGELFKNPTLADTFRTLGAEGKKGFYSGRIGEEIIKIIQDLGGHVELQDLAQHMELGSERVDPISLTFTGQGTTSFHAQHIDGLQETLDDNNFGVEVWEHPPNGQGIVALMALGLFEEFERTGKIPRFTESEHNSALYIHAVVEALRISFADVSWWITDPNVVKIPTAELISKAYLAERAKLFDQSRAADLHDRGSPAHNHSDTVYFAVSDRDGNAISFINSNYGGFGMGAIPKGCGFTLQNRGSNFSLDKNHPNVLAPGKRPYHTIIPALVTNKHDGSLHSVYGVMGGFMQPQGHVQVLLNQLVFKHNPQTALDAPRFCIGAGLPEEGNVLDPTIHLEQGISPQVYEELKQMGHKVAMVEGYKRSMFGRGQLIRSHVENGKTVYSGGSDPRGDGHAVPM